MGNAVCRNHANHNEYGIGSFNLGMGNAGSKWYANPWGSWGAWGMLAWGMQGATPMPRAKNVGTAYAIGMLAWGMLPAYGMPTILAWVLLQECSPYWHGM
jgi:hypothetical protein